MALDYSRVFCRCQVFASSFSCCSSSFRSPRSGVSVPRKATEFTTPLLVCGMVTPGCSRLNLRYVASSPSRRVSSDTAYSPAWHVLHPFGTTSAVSTFQFKVHIICQVLASLNDAWGGGRGMFVPACFPLFLRYRNGFRSCIISYRNVEALTLLRANRPSHRLQASEPSSELLSSLGNWADNAVGGNYGIVDFLCRLYCPRLTHGGTNFCHPLGGSSAPSVRFIRHDFLVPVFPPCKRPWGRVVARGPKWIIRNEVVFFLLCPPTPCFG